MSKPEIILARSAGFCFGVQRAVSKVYDETDRGGDIYTYGPIIHNTEVVADLEKRGVHVVESAEEISSLKQGTVIIRSHGVSREIDTLIRESGLRCIDATCPFVKRIHSPVDPFDKGEKDRHHRKPRPSGGDGDHGVVLHTRHGHPDSAGSC